MTRDYYLVREVAQRLKVSRAAVYKRKKAGNLTIQKPNAAVPFPHILAAEVTQWQKERREHGRKLMGQT